MNSFFANNANRFSVSGFILSLMAGFFFGILTYTGVLAILVFPLGLLKEAVLALFGVSLWGSADLIILGAAVVVYFWATRFPKYSAITVAWMVAFGSLVVRAQMHLKGTQSILQISWLDSMPLYISWLGIVPTIILFTLAYKYGHKKYMKRWEAAKLAIQAEADAHKTCPHCAEVILAEAKVCKHCGRDI